MVGRRCARRGRVPTASRAIDSVSLFVALEDGCGAGLEALLMLPRCCVTDIVVGKDLVPQRRNTRRVYAQSRLTDATSPTYSGMGRISKSTTRPEPSTFHDVAAPPT